MMYEGIRDGAIRPLIKQYGYQMFLQYTGPGTVDENSGIVTPGVQQTWPVDGLEVDFEIKDIDGTVIKSGDKLIILSTDGTLPEPNTDYTLLLVSGIWQVQSCNPISPGGVVLTYELHVRK